MRSASIRRWVTVTALIVALGSGRQASAQNFGNLDIDLGFDRVFAGMGLVLLSLGNTGLAVTELAFTGKGRQSFGLAAGSFFAAGVGIAAGASAMSAWEEGTLRTLGIASIVCSGLNVALAVVQLVQPGKEERHRVAVAPVTLVDASGQLTAGAGLTGSF